MSLTSAAPGKPPRIALDDRDNVAVVVDWGGLIDSHATFLRVAAARYDRPP